MSEPEEKSGAKTQRSFGEELRRERELRQISLREVAEATKIHVRFLEALEHNDFDALPGGFFTRGFIKSYARHIGLNEEAMVNAFLMELNQQLRRSAPEPAPILEPPPESGPPSRASGRGVRSITAGASLLAFFGLAFLLWTGVRHMGEEAAATRPEPNGHRPPVALPEATAGQAEPVAIEMESLPVPAPEPAPQPAPEPARPSPPEQLVVQLRLTQRAWIRLLCDGHEAVNRTLRAGTVRSFTCFEEVSLSTTDAGAVQVEINGATLELSGSPGDRIVPTVVRREEWLQAPEGAREVTR